MNILSTKIATTFDPSLSVKYGLYSTKHLIHCWEKEASYQGKTRRVGTVGRRGGSWQLQSSFSFGGKFPTHDDEVNSRSDYSMLYHISSWSFCTVTNIVCLSFAWRLHDVCTCVFSSVGVGWRWGKGKGWWEKKRELGALWSHLSLNTVIVKPKRWQGWKLGIVIRDAEGLEATPYAATVAKPLCWSIHDVTCVTIICDLWTRREIITKSGPVFRFTWVRTRELTCWYNHEKCLHYYNRKHDAKTERWGGIGREKNGTEREVGDRGGLYRAREAWREWLVLLRNEKLIMRKDKQNINGGTSLIIYRDGFKPHDEAYKALTGTEWPVQSQTPT